LGLDSSQNSILCQQENSYSGSSLLNLGKESKKKESYNIEADKHFSTQKYLKLKVAELENKV
jgi:hypothetical protein